MYMTHNNILNIKLLRFWSISIKSPDLTRYNIITKNIDIVFFYNNTVFWEDIGKNNQFRHLSLFPWFLVIMVLLYFGLDPKVLNRPFSQIPVSCSEAKSWCIIGFSNTRWPTMIQGFASRYRRSKLGDRARCSSDNIPLIFFCRKILWSILNIISTVYLLTDEGY